MKSYYREYYGALAQELVAECGSSRLFLLWFILSNKFAAGYGEDGQGDTDGKKDGQGAWGYQGGE